MLNALITSLNKRERKRSKVELVWWLMLSHWFKFVQLFLSFILHYYLLFMFTFTYRSRLVWKGKIWRLGWEATQTQKVCWWWDEVRVNLFNLLRMKTWHLHLAPTPQTWFLAKRMRAAVLFWSSSSSPCPQFMFDNR